MAPHLPTHVLALVVGQPFAVTAPQPRAVPLMNMIVRRDSSVGVAHARDVCGDPFGEVVLHVPCRCVTTHYCLIVVRPGTHRTYCGVTMWDRGQAGAPHALLAPGGFGEPLHALGLAWGRGASAGHAVALRIQSGQFLRGGRGADTPCRPSGVLGPRAVAASVAGRFDVPLGAALPPLDDSRLPSDRRSPRGHIACSPELLHIAKFVLWPLRKLRESCPQVAKPRVPEVTRSLPGGIRSCLKFVLTFLREPSFGTTPTNSAKCSATSGNTWSKFGR